MSLDLVLPQMFPCVKFFAALFTSILHSSSDESRVLFYSVVADKPLCYSYQVATIIFGMQFYMDILVILKNISIKTLK